jgi:ribonuclease VapC
MIFVDASALVAIICGEPEAPALVASLDSAAEMGALTSAIAIYEAVLGVRRVLRGSLEDARQDVSDLISRAGIGVVPITPADAELALAAFARYGKGQGHPAQLNMGDCFAYASARRHGARLLCKGDDFRRTDLRLA